MRKKNFQIIFDIAIVAAIGFLLYLYRDQLRLRAMQLETRFFPCRQPISYTIDSFDSRFGISKSDFLRAIQDAEQIWEKPIGKELFVYQPNGNLKINLVYDFRQEATVTLRKLGLSLSNDQASYNAVKGKYDDLKAVYAKEKEALDSGVAVFESHKNAYEAEVKDWNSRGGAPRDVYDHLEQEKTSLDAEIAQINHLRSAINSRVEDINSLVTVLNHMVSVLNLQVAKFNEIGLERGREFEEGVYQTGPKGQKIEIYQFDNKRKLVRVLAHELGHALGLAHVENPRAIMYRLNQDSNEKVTFEDLAEVKQHCAIK